MSERPLASAREAFAVAALQLMRRMVDTFPGSVERTEIADLLEQLSDRVVELLELEEE